MGEVGVDKVGMFPALRLAGSFPVLSSGRPNEGGCVLVYRGSPRCQGDCASKSRPETPEPLGRAEAV